MRGGNPFLVGQLLEYAAQFPSDPSDRRYPWRFDGVARRELQWVIDAGLAPLLYTGTRQDPDCVPDAWRDVLTSADLTARVRHGNRVETANEVIDACGRIGTRATLLKGISISEQFYPLPHLRPMGDIDVLVPVDAREAVESAVLDRGYRRLESHIDSVGQHHGAPLYDPKHHVWVEIHTALFPSSDRAWINKVFSPSNIAAQSVRSTFHGNVVNRLSSELQLAYIAYSWMRDLNQRRIHPSFAISLFDGVYLLKESGRGLDWKGVLSWLDNDMAMASLWVLLSYLAHRRVADFDRTILSRLRTGQRLAGAPQRWAIQLLLDHYLIGGRYWNLPFPPPAPERYTLRYQFRKRVVGRPGP